MPPSVSVVIPCHNGLPYLRQALASAADQTLPPERIVVVDDGSTDASAAVVEQFARERPLAGVRLIRQANAGEPAARNAGIGVCQAESRWQEAGVLPSEHWIAQLDADDYWEPNKLELQMRAAQAAGDDVVLVHTGLMRHFPDGRQEPSDFAAAARRTGRCTLALLEPTSIGHPSIMVRASALKQVGGYDPSFKQACDIDLYFRLSAIGSFAFVPQPLLHYRIHPGQMSASQLQQIAYHHLAVRRFFMNHPKMEAEIGRDRIEQALADHLAVKLQSLYWRRQLKDFRRLLDYARQQRIHGRQIDLWRKRSRWPDWVIRLHDRLTTLLVCRKQRPA